jgi:hypothetical protein
MSPWRRKKKGDKLLIDEVKAHEGFMVIGAPPDDPRASSEEMMEVIFEAARNSICFNVNSIQDMYYAQYYKSDDWDMYDVSLLQLPPYPRTWIEARDEGATYAVLAETVEAPPKDEYPNEIPDGTRYTTFLSVFCSDRGMDFPRRCFPSVAMYHTDECGRPTSPMGVRSYSELPPDKRGSLEAAIDQAVDFAAFVFRLLSCKNVVEVVNPISDKLQKRRRRNGKQPLTEFRTVKISIPGQRVFAKNSSERSSEIEKRFHTVRGHFAEYTEKNKLFGKIIGRFWIPAHVRGNKNLGAIHKSYELEPAKSKETAP